MSLADVEKKVDNLEEQMKELSKPAMSKLTIGTIVTIAVLILSGAGGWFTLRAEVTNLSEDTKESSDINIEQDKKIQSIEVKNAEKDSDMKYIRKQLDSIDKKLEDIAKK
jgi:ABC-type bacteriocin/lantibiotic exporter with double-glycine peptidase domain